jgi:hypothetical protein
MFIERLRRIISSAHHGIALSWQKMVAPGRLRFPKIGIS